MSEQPGIRGVIFDMDGVLTDSEPLINAAAIAMFKEKGLVVQPNDFLPFVGAGENRYIGGVAEKYHFPLDLPAAKRRTYEIYLELVPTQLKAFPGAEGLIRACRGAGLRLAVASSADEVKIVANLRQIGLPPDSWDAVVAGDDVAAKKPAPDIFLSAAAKLGLTPVQCVVVEDAVNGVQAAKAAGMRCVAVAQTFPAAQLQSADLVRPDIAAVSLADLTGTGAASTPNAQPPVIGNLPPGAPTSPPVVEAGPWGLWATLGLTAALAGAFVLVQTLVVLVWVVVGAASGRHLVPRDLEANGLLLSLATCASAPVVISLTYLFARIRRGTRVADYLALRPMPFKSAVRWTAVFLAFLVLSDCLTAYLGRPIVPDFMVRIYRTAGFMPLLALAIILVAPVMEEVVYRGFLFEGLAHSCLGQLGAIMLTLLLWSLTHTQYDVYGIATIFISGLLLGHIRLKTGSLYVTILLHGLMNLVATLEVVLMLGGSRSGR